jgi:hypothetical protein
MKRVNLVDYDHGISNHRPTRPRTKRAVAFGIFLMD